MRSGFLFLILSNCCYELAAQPALITDTQSLPQISLLKNIACPPVRDQSSSPTCWVFGTNSLFESDLLKEKSLSPDLSEMFIARYAYIDKARQYLRTGGKTYFEGGGQFRDVLRVIERYGMVPEHAYRGRPRNELTHNHANLDTAVQGFVKALQKKGRKDLSKDQLKQLSDTLDKYLGVVPSEFSYKGKPYTPLSFARSYLQFDPADYIELVSFNDKPYYKKFLLEDKYNWSADSFYNVTLSDLEMVVDSALEKGFSIGWEGDVTEPGFKYLEGIAVSGGEPYDYDSMRVANYKSERTERDHMLHLTGVGKDADGLKWYYLKNSWGETNNLKGFLYMELSYFHLKTVILMANRKALPRSLLQKLSIK